jgi:5-formyltetrahydrofolate cyclo-ligase
MKNPKQELRDQARKHRSRIDVFAEDPEDAAKLFFETLKPVENTVIAAYCPQGREFDALCVLEMAIEKGMKTVLPVIQPDSRILKFHAWDKQTELKANKYKIQEPAKTEELEPDIIITPLLAFDRRGTRLGQGGGYYDATLEHLRAQKEVLAVGMAHSEQAVLFNLPREDHDQPLDWVITPKEAHYFGEI